MRTLIIILCLLLVPVASFAAATATLTSVDSRADGALLTVSVVDDVAGQWEDVFKISNAEIANYSTWNGFVSGWLSPKIIASVSEHRTIANRVSFIQSKIGQQMQVP